MSYSDEELELALARFASSCPKSIALGYGVLEAESRVILPPYISLIVPARGRDDVLQDVLIKLLQGQPKFDDQGVKAWKRFMRMIAYHCSIDWIKGNRTEYGLEDVVFGTWDHHSPSRDYLDTLAGQAWFGYSKDVPLAERNRRALAVELRLEHREMSLDEICEMANGRRATAQDRDDLRSWLEDVAVLRDVAYRALYADGHELVRVLLDLPDTPDLFEIAFLASHGEPDAVGLNGWTNAETATIVWRYGFGLLKASILVRPDNSLSDKEFEELCERCDSKFPFENYMLRIMRALGSRTEAVFAKQNVFKRLAFECCYRDNLSQKDILPRIAVPALQVGYRLESGTLNMWLSGGRLFKDLRDEEDGH